MLDRAEIYLRYHTMPPYPVRRHYAMVNHDSIGIPNNLRERIWTTPYDLGELNDLVEAEPIV